MNLNIFPGSLTITLIIQLQANDRLCETNTLSFNDYVIGKSYLNSIKTSKKCKYDYLKWHLKITVTLIFFYLKINF